MAEQQVRFTLPKDQVLDMVRAGVRDVLREAVTGVDVYAAIRDGVEAATRAVREREATTGATRQEPEPSASVAEKGPEP
jgi:hypothetical protein